MSGASVAGEVARPTLVGVATGTPDGGVAIVRLSGADARSIAAELGATDLSERRLIRRSLRFRDGSGCEHKEDALVVFMAGPRSFTGEDVVELNVHGGVLNVGLVVQGCIQVGARAAGPGDFTRRAFELGRLSLDQAEGLAAVVGAQTEEALRQARTLAAGQLGESVDALVGELRDLRAELETQLDFAEDVGQHNISGWIGCVERLSATVGEWLLRFEAGRRARERVRIVLGGAPNAGKSSLFNALVGSERAIVSAHAGTTRDYVEAQLEIGGVACVLIDTAGIRDCADEVERLGVERSRQQIDGADLCLWVYGADQEDGLVVMGEGQAVVEVETKRDVGVRRPHLAGVVVGGPAPAEGVLELRERLTQVLQGMTAAPWIGLARHRERASEALGELGSAQRQLDEGVLELAAFHLGVAQARLEEIRGRSSVGPVGEEILARIFSQFCIGK